MAEEEGPPQEIVENPLIARLIEQGAETAMTLRGYVGPSPSEDHVRIYPRLGNLLVSIDVARSDILHFIEAPRSGLGAIILWVRRDAQIAVHRVETSESAAAPAQDADLVDVKKGRLHMRVRAQAREVCFSVCMDCVSWCDCKVGSSQCTIVPIAPPE